MKLSQFIAKASHINATLIRSTVAQIGGWEEFKENAQDVANHGADAGWVGFTWHHDTVAFTQRNKTHILSMAKDQASSYGGDGVISFLCGFSCLKGYSQEEIADGLYNYRSEDRTQVYNALAWYALEEVCRAYADIVYDERHG